MPAALIARGIGDDGGSRTYIQSSHILCKRPSREGSQNFPAKPVWTQGTSIAFCSRRTYRHLRFRRASHLCIFPFHFRASLGRVLVADAVPRSESNERR